jgi:hypothetical protein
VPMTTTSSLRPLLLGKSGTGSSTLSLDALSSSSQQLSQFPPNARTFTTPPLTIPSRSEPIPQALNSATSTIRDALSAGSSSSSSPSSTRPSSTYLQHQNANKLFQPPPSNRSSYLSTTETSSNYHPSSETSSLRSQAATIASRESSGSGNKRSLKNLFQRKLSVNPPAHYQPSSNSLSLPPPPSGSASPSSSFFSKPQPSGLVSPPASSHSNSPFNFLPSAASRSSRSSSQPLGSGWGTSPYPPLPSASSAPPASIDPSQSHYSPSLAQSFPQTQLTTARSSPSGSIASTSTRKPSTYALLPHPINSADSARSRSPSRTGIQSLAGSPPPPPLKPAATSPPAVFMYGRGGASRKVSQVPLSRD